MIQAVDRVGLVAEAARHDCLIVIPHAVGDLVPHGDALIEVHGHGSLPSADRLRGMVALGEERTIEQDTAFALRILVDIAIRALSPAVNDPTTAVQVLGALEDLLLLIGESDLAGRGTLRDAAGRPARADRGAALGRPARARADRDPRLRRLLDAGHAPRPRAARGPGAAGRARAPRGRGRAARRARRGAWPDATADTLSRALAALPDRQGIGGPSADTPDVIPSS